LTLGPLEQIGTGHYAQDSSLECVPGTLPWEESYLEGRLRIDVGARRVAKDEIEISLTPTEFDLLESLRNARGRVLSRRSLWERLRSWDHHGQERGIDVHIRHLREKLEDDPSVPRIIATVRAVGYRFVPEPDAKKG